MLSAYYVLLNKYTNQTDIVVGTAAAGRLHPDLQDVFGVFVNTHPGIFQNKHRVEQRIAVRLPYTIEFADQIIKRILGIVKGRYRTLFRLLQKFFKAVGSINLVPQSKCIPQTQWCTGV